MDFQPRNPVTSPRSCWGSTHRIIRPPIRIQTNRTISTMVSKVIPPGPIIAATISVIATAATEQQNQQDNQKQHKKPPIRFCSSKCSLRRARCLDWGAYDGYLPPHLRDKV